MKTVICTTAKNENQYINDWATYYFNLGFDLIYLYDNNDSDTPYVGNFLDDQIKNKVIVINKQNIHESGLQHKLYQEFYDTYSTTFDWCLFCDIDEFLTGINNIKEFLTQDRFKNFEQIRIKWQLFGDDNQITRDMSIPVYKAFTHKIIDKPQLINQGKCILRGNLTKIKFKSCHHAKAAKREVISCLPSGKYCSNEKFEITDNYTNETVFINHYMTKTLKEFLDQKLNRGDCVYADRNIDLSYFWQLNTKTVEKLNFISYYLLNIDLVVPYVDATDKEWQKVFFKAKKIDNEESVALNRFRSQGDFFRYFFRSIAKNMPWLHQVFLLVMSETQVPAWIDRSKVKIITHDQFIPKEYLPTFNSGTIEMFLQNIPGLSEHFIYTNDDIYALRPLLPTHFFSNQKLCFNLVSDTNVAKNDWRQMCQNNHDLIFGTKHAVPFLRLDHEFRPYIKSKMLDCFALYKPQILNSISQFRDKKNLTVYLYSLYLVKNNQQCNTPLDIKYACSTNHKADLTKKLNTADTICLNDTSTDINIYALPIVSQFFYNKFTTKCKYEQYDTDTLQAAANKATEILLKKDEKPKDERADGQSNCYLYF